METLNSNSRKVLLEEVSPDRSWETRQGLRMLLGVFRGGNPLERIVGMSSKCCGENSPHNPASVYECVGSFCNGLAEMAREHRLNSESLVRHANTKFVWVASVFVSG